MEAQSWPKESRPTPSRSSTCPRGSLVMPVDKEKTPQQAVYLQCAPAAEYVCKWKLENPLLLPAQGVLDREAAGPGTRGP